MMPEDFLDSLVAAESKNLALMSSNWPPRKFNTLMMVVKTLSCKRLLDGEGLRNENHDSEECAPLGLISRTIEDLRRAGARDQVICDRIQEEAHIYFFEHGLRGQYSEVRDDGECIGLYERLHFELRDLLSYLTSGM